MHKITTLITKKIQYLKNVKNLSIKELLLNKLRTFLLFTRTEKITKKHSYWNYDEYALCFGFQEVEKQHVQAKYFWRKSTSLNCYGKEKYFIVSNKNANTVGSFFFILSQIDAKLPKTVIQKI